MFVSFQPRRGRQRVARRREPLDCSRANDRALEGRKGSPAPYRKSGPTFALPGLGGLLAENPGARATWLPTAAPSGAPKTAYICRTNHSEGPAPECELSAGLNV